MLKYKAILLISMLIFVFSCTTRIDGPDDTGDQLFPPIGVDSLVEIVTWNMEFPGDFNSDFWTEDKEIKLAELIESMNVDIIAFQEFPSQAQLDRLLKRLSGYDGLLSPDINYNQKTGIIFKTETVSASFGVPRSLNGDYTRDPLQVDVTVSSKYGTFQTRLEIVHLKARSGYEDVRQRENELIEQYLHTYLADNPGKSAIVLGDFNDTLDDSLVFGAWYRYPDLYRFATDKIWDNPLMASYPGFGSMIDHLLLSKELFGPGSPYLENETITINFNTLVSGYGSVSDHRPVMAKFRFIPN